MTTRQAKFRPSRPEALEGRVVPSSASAAVPSLHAQLTRVGALVDAAYAGFATSVRQSELTLVSPGGTASSVSAELTQEVANLATAVASAVQGRAGSNALGLLQQEFTGGSPGSLSVELAQLLQAASAGSANGSVPAATLPLLFTAIDGAVASSLDSTSIAIDLYATGAASGGFAGRALNLPQYGTRVNAAFTGFATAARQAETALVAPGGPSAPVGVAATIGGQVGTLSRAIGSTLAGTRAASVAALIRGQFDGPSPGSLDSRVAGLIVASTSGSANGSVPAASLPLLFAAIDQAISSSYDAIAIEGNLLASLPGLPSASNGGGATPTDFSSYGVFFAR